MHNSDKHDTIPAYLSIIKNKLEELPGKISKADEDLYRAQVRKLDAEHVLKSEELRIISMIAGEVDSATGKARYPNDTLRQAEFVKRRDTDLSYSQAQTELAEADRDVAAYRRETMRLSNEFSGQKQIADLFSGYMRTRV